MGLPNSYHPHSARVIHQIIRGNLVTFKFFLVFLSKLGTLLLDSLGGKGKNMTSLACLRNAGSYSTVTYCNTFKFKTCEEISLKFLKAVSLLFLHRPHRHRPVGKRMRLLTKRVGCSRNANAHVARSRIACSREHNNDGKMCVQTSAKPSVGHRSVLQ